MIVCLIGGIIAVVTADNLYENGGTFEDFPNMDGNWERAADSDGPLHVDSSRKVYIDIADAEDVFISNSNFISYAVNPMFAGTYWLSTSIHLPCIAPNEHGNEFNGAWWDYEANGHRRPQAADEPQDINFTSAYSWANGASPEPDDPMESGSDLQPVPPPEDEQCRVYAHVP